MEQRSICFFPLLACHQFPFLKTSFYEQFLLFLSLTQANQILHMTMSRILQDYFRITWRLSKISFMTSWRLLKDYFKISSSQLTCLVDYNFQLRINYIVKFSSTDRGSFHFSLSYSYTSQFSFADAEHGTLNSSD